MGPVPNAKFGRCSRLLSQSDFQEVFDANTCKISHPNLLILAKFNVQRNSRLGLVVGKKNVPCAAKRNALKRVVRETFRQEQFSPPIDVVFLARRGADHLNPPEIALLLQQSWGRLQRRFLALQEKHA